VEHFWRVYDHLVRPNDQKTSTIDYHLFKNGIKPTWEDTQNANGGKWIVRLRKGLASKYWEELILAIIGEQFDVGQEICGAVVSVRGNEDIIRFLEIDLVHMHTNMDLVKINLIIRIYVDFTLLLLIFLNTNVVSSVWNKTADNLEATNKIRYLTLCL
jgi:Eukaryotic initiation factor 4E